MTAPGNSDVPTPPALLQPPPKRGPGVRRLNRVPLLLASVAGVGIVLAVGYTYREKLAQAVTRGQHAEDRKAEPGDAAAVLNNAPAGGQIEAAAFRTPLAASRPAGVPVQAGPVTPVPGNVGADAEDAATKARREAWAAYYQQLGALRQARFDAARSALASDTSLQPGGGGAAPPVAPAGSGPPANPQLAGAQQDAGAAQEATAAAPGVPPAANVMPPGLGFGMGGFGAPLLPAAGVDSRAQAEKRAFLHQPGDTSGQSDELQASIRAPGSPYQVMQGTAIPAVMIGGLNSDMPGMVIGQVAGNVYDTATGRYLLIPQNTRLIGQYDNSVSAGQTRVGVVWNRLIFPDTQSLDLGSMEGADQAGYAGFHDQVNTHFWSKLGNAVLLSIAGGAAMVGQGTGVGANGYSAQQIMAASLGQQFAELGQIYAQAGLSIPDTLEIRPGYRFVVMVAKDITLRPYVDHRTQATPQPASFGPVVQ
jgi:type IV secretory pathway VirB10-like protein